MSATILREKIPPTISLRKSPGLAGPLQISMNTYEIIRRHYALNPDAMEGLIAHSEAVARMALEVASRVAHLNPDRAFIEEAALLHDIGIYLTHAPGIGCRGDLPYICHGYLGAELLRNEGLPRHALVCESHVGVGVTAREIAEKGFQLPVRDMLPVTIEEKIIGFADKFYSKDGSPNEQKSIEVVRLRIARYGPGKVEIFDEWCKLFK